LATFLELAWEG